MPRPAGSSNKKPAPPADKGNVARLDALNTELARQLFKACQLMEAVARTHRDIPLAYHAGTIAGFLDHAGFDFEPVEKEEEGRALLSPCLGPETIVSQEKPYSILGARPKRDDE